MAKSRPDKNAFYTTPDTFSNTDKHTYTDTDAHAYTEEQPETKSKRAYLLVRPSVWDSLSKIAKKNHRSNNDIVNELIEQYVEENK
jgi:hypothetical protein